MGDGRRGDEEFVGATRDRGVVARALKTRMVDKLAKQRHGNLVLTSSPELGKLRPRKRGLREE